MIFAVDVGGTKIKIGLVHDGQVIARSSIDAHSDKGLQPQLRRIADTGRELIAQQGLDISDFKAISMSFPSLIDVKRGKVLFGYGKFMDAIDLDLPKWAMDDIGLPLFIENDARVALLGEWKQGAGRNHENLVMITLGTGLGAAALIEGQIVRGVHGQAGILGGHLSQDPNGHICHCGSRGCSEAEASTSVLADRAKALLSFEFSELRYEKTLDYHTVFELATKGDECAIALKNRAVEVWSTMIIQLIHAYDPEVFIVGGGIAAGWDHFMPEVIDRVHKWVHTPWGSVNIVPAMLGNDAALVGCEVLVS